MNLKTRLRKLEKAAPTPAWMKDPRGVQDLICNFVTGYAACANSVVG